MHVENIAPTPAIYRLQKAGEPHVIKQIVPLERILQIAHRPVGSALWKLLMRKNRRPRNRYAKFIGQCIIEKFIVRRPPEGIVDNERTLQCSMFKERAVERN